jgi:hypothetical protein
VSDPSDRHQAQRWRDLSTPAFAVLMVLFFIVVGIITELIHANE